MPTSIPELIGRKATEDEIAVMAGRCSRGKTISVGNFKVLRYDAMVDVYHLANE